MAPFKIFLGTSIAITILLKIQNVPYLPSRSLVMTGFEIFAIETVAWLVWRCLLYPNLFSPLRELPGPSVCPLYILCTLKLPSLAVDRAALS